MPGLAGMCEIGESAAKTRRSILLVPVMLSLLVLTCTRGPVPAGNEIVVLATAEPASETTLPRGGYERLLEVAGQTRSYFFQFPGTSSSVGPLPVVLVFHGGGGNAENARRMTGFDEAADRLGFVAVFPNGSGRLEEHLLTWNGGRCCGYAMEQGVDEVAFVEAILDDLGSMFEVDQKRIYATGMSNGAILAYRLACEMADRIAAIGPVAATQNIETCQPVEPVSVSHFHGTADMNAPYEGGVGEDSIAGVEFAPVQESIAFWVRRNGCPEQPRVESAGSVRHEIYDPCERGTVVELHTILGGEHAWPGGEPGFAGASQPTDEISATELLWAFFEAHPKP